jgi:hypothetical protein
MDSNIPIPCSRRTVVQARIVRSIARWSDRPATVVRIVAAMTINIDM